MDDRQRLLRLVSLVAWAGERDSNECGLRFANSSDEQQWYGGGRAWAARTERGENAPEPKGLDLRTSLWALTSWYTGAVWSGNDPAKRDLDTREFPGVAYYAVQELPDDVLAMLGRTIRTSLRFNFDVDELELARRWAEDVRATAWRLLVAEREDYFGRYE
ncbi:hypothetical protein ND748_00990 [Frankia sp. AiPs1]|uniref:hypothetical protein n=1 Tax=Frankia sp. AiPs1 TaxID=573493 RepID=UPI002043C8DF|nr:hypothetical protein [Frankia sp. AiPs1]MCM3920265.1 hypothetical protein [Frankia sp. AiPs1]